MELSSLAEISAKEQLAATLIKKIYFNKIECFRSLFKNNTGSYCASSSGKTSGVNVLGVL